MSEGRLGIGRGWRPAAIFAGACLISGAGWGASAVATEELKPLKPQQRLAAAQRLASLLPEARAGWKSSRARTSWRRNRIEATRRYRAPEGFDSFTIKYETHSKSLTYKRDLLRNPKAAKRRGYDIKKFEGQLALVRDLGHKREVRIWPSRHVLVMAVGTAKLEEIEMHLKLVKFKEVGTVHFGPKGRKKQ